MTQGTRRTMIAAKPQTPPGPRSIARPRAPSGAARPGFCPARDPL